MIKKLANFIDSRFLHICIQKWKWKKVQFLQNVLVHFFKLSKPEVAYLGPFLSSPSFSKFWKQNCMYFRHKNLETVPNGLHKLATFLKYHISLSAIEIGLFCLIESHLSQFVHKSSMQKRVGFMNYKYFWIKSFRCWKIQYFSILLNPKFFP